jgi:hypothetical protein
VAGEDEPARKEQRFAELSTGLGHRHRRVSTETVRAQLDARELARRMTNATRVVPEAMDRRQGKAPDDIESHGGRTEGSGKSAGWKLALAAALKSRTTATNRWLSTALYFHNLYEVSTAFASTTSGASAFVGKAKTSTKSKS